MILFTMPSKRIKYVEINLTTKKAQDLYMETKKHC